MNNSFYGGRDGQPMIIKAKFPTVFEMTEHFKNAEYTTVNFGEYALIETINKKNPENGMLFRRGYDYFDETRQINQWLLDTEFASETYGRFIQTPISAYGAIEIGKISGPGGDAPHLHLNLSEDQVKQMIEDNKYADIDEFVGGSGELSVGSGLISGEESKGKVTYHWCSIRDENGYDTNAYIGFTIPYFDFGIVVNIEDYFYGLGENQPFYERSQDAANPFYEQWKFHIPRGVKGDSIEWIKIAYENEYTDLKQFDYDKPTGSSFALKNYSKSAGGDKQILVASIWQWDGKKEVNTIVYLGDYRVVKEMRYEDAEYKQGENGEIITVQKDGKIIIDYSDGTNQELLTVNPFTVGEDISFGKYNEPGENLRVNGIHFVLDGWDPNPEDEEKDYNIIHYPGGSLAPISEESLLKILNDEEGE